jgi:chromosome segregation ATPase
LRDEQMQDFGEEIGDRDARIGQLEGQVQTLETTVGEHEEMIEFLEEQIHDLNTSWRMPMGISTCIMHSRQSFTPHQT